MNFIYKIRDIDGQIQTSVAQAETKGILVRELQKRGIQPLSILPAPARMAAKLPNQGIPLVLGQKNSAKKAYALGKLVKDQEVLFFTRDLYTLVRSGIPLSKGIKDLTFQVRNIYLKKALHQIVEDIEAGGRLSEAFGRHPDIFNDIYCNCLQVGEEGGKLEGVLLRLYTIMDQDIEVQKTVKNALRYPIIVLCFLGVAFALIVGFILPKFIKMFADKGADLPLPTKILIAVGSFSQHYAPFIVISAGLVFVIFTLWKKTESGRYHWGAMKLKIPIFGALHKLGCMSHFASSLQLLYSSGVTLPEAVKLTARGTGNDYIGRLISAMHKEMNQGVKLSDSMQSTQLMPPLMMSMISIGEESGRLDEMLIEIAKHFDREVQYMAKAMGTLIEPIITVILGGMVMVLALGLMLPMWKSYSLILGS